MTQPISFTTGVAITYDDLEQVLPPEARKEIQHKNSIIKGVFTVAGWDFQGRKGIIIAVAGVSLILIALVFGLLHQRFLPPGISPLSGQIVVGAYATIGTAIIVGGVICFIYSKFFKSALLETVTQRIVFKPMIMRHVVPLLNQDEVIAFVEPVLQEMDVYAQKSEYYFAYPIELSNHYFFQGKTFLTLANVKDRISSIAR